MLTACILLALISSAVSFHFYRKLRKAGIAPFGYGPLDPRRDAVLKSVLEGLGDSCVLVDESMRVVFTNHEFKELFGVKSPQRGRELSDLIADQNIMQFIRRSWTSGAKWLEEEFQTSLRHNEHEDQRWLVVAAAPVKLYGYEEARHLRVVIRDETDRHDTEQVRKDFVANASHELRTPLSIINGYLENLCDGVIDDPAMVKKSLATMKKHGERIARLVEDMLTLSKFESVNLAASLSRPEARFSCHQSARDVIERLSSMIDAMHTTVELEFPPEGQDLICGDQFYWDQILFNLVENAIKENVAGHLKITIKMTRTAQECFLFVKDNGVGIPRADIPFIFKRFYRVAKHHSQQIKGTGLGLSIVRRAVEAHGGSISVDSTPGIETVFTIRLPEQK